MGRTQQKRDYLFKVNTTASGKLNYLLSDTSFYDLVIPEMEAKVLPIRNYSNNYPGIYGFNPGAMNTNLW